MNKYVQRICKTSSKLLLQELSSLTCLDVESKYALMNNLKESKRDVSYGCLNCGHPHSELKAEVGTIFYCKDCDKYEQIVHISEGGISTFERLEKEELLQLLSEGRVKIIDNNGLRDEKCR